MTISGALQPILDSSRHTPHGVGLINRARIAVYCVTADPDRGQPPATVRGRIRNCSARSAHRDELLGACWVDSDRIVEIAFRRAHADGHGKALQHLVGTLADDVATDDFLLWPHANEFHRTARSF